MVQLVEARLNDMDAEYKARLDNMSADLVGIDAVKMLQNDRLDGIDADQITQDGRLDDIEAEQIVQNGRLDDIVVDQITQDGRLVGIDAEQLIQNMRLDDIETEQTAQNMRLDDIESQPGGSAGGMLTFWAVTCDFQQYGILTIVATTSLCRLPLNLETPSDVRSVV